MIKKFLYLEWKSFFRSAAFAKNMAMKILMIFVAIYFALVFLGLGIGAFFLLKKLHLDPLQTINRYMIYYLIFDLMFRVAMQKIPVLNIRPLLSLPIKSNTIVHFSLGKTILSFFNWGHAFFFIPFSIVLITKGGYNAVQILLWHLSIIALVYCNNFLNILLNNKDNLFTIFLIITAGIYGLQHFNYFNITDYTVGFFQSLYNSKFMILIPFLVVLVLYFVTFRFFKSNFYLDSGLASKSKIATSENLSWLNQFGTLGIFLKNDIKLLKRNKRSKTTLTMSFLFLFYGLIFFRTEQLKIMEIFAGIFVSGGFLFTFGQFVPSWDSSYYNLMMTQNIPYRNYITSKWWLIVIGTVISTILTPFYLYFGTHAYLCILAGAIYNIGVNSHLVLWGGAYTKTPVDLNSSQGAFGDKKAFNFQTLLITFPKLLIPVALYGVGLIHSQNLGLALVAFAGILGFALRNKVFNLIEKVYIKEKYKTIDAYKQKN